MAKKVQVDKELFLEVLYLMEVGQETAINSYYATDPSLQEDYRRSQEILEELKALGIK